MKCKVVTFLLVCTSLITQAQLKKGQLDPAAVPIPVQHYQQEYVFDEATDLNAWKNVKPDMQVSFATTDELYLRKEIPQINQTLTWSETGWRGERLNAQVLVWSRDTVEQVRVLATDLKDDKGNIIDKEQWKIHLVRYVISNYPYASTEASCDVAATNTAYLMPDRFETLDRFDLPGNTVRPVWLSLDVPDGAKAGVYVGAINVISTKGTITLNVKVRVQSALLPKPYQWKFRLDLWQNPWVIANYYQVAPWSEEHLLLLKKHMQLYADAGGKFITTYAVHSPWSDNSYSIEGNMIEWIKQKNGRWKFDYTIFDKYVTLCMQAGVREAITIYTPVPWGYRFRYYEEATGNFENAEWPPESAAFTEPWNIFLTDLKSHLDTKGWFDKTYLGINENPLSVTIAAAKVIKAHSKNWKITYAGDWHAELSELLDDYSVIISKEPSQAELNARKARGFTTTYYVCCTPPRPNNFVFSPPIEGRFISWYSAAYKYDGFLRWAFDAWPEDPMRDARHTLWPAGDCFLVYPGGNSSIRYEKLREGIVDFEKINMLRELALKSSDKKIKSDWTKFETHLATFIDNPDYNKRDYTTEKLTRQVHTGIKMIEQLSDQLIH